MSNVILITGASAGIGEAAARRLATEPAAELVLVARREEKLQALAAELAPVRCTVAAVDLTAAGAPARVREVIEREHRGRLNLLVNNAGAAWRGRFDETGWANIERHMRLNFEAPVKLTEALLPLLKASAAAGERVAVVNIASTAARVSRPNSGAYSCSKFAFAAWSDAIAGELTGDGIHVGLVLPGFVKTEGFPAAELLAKPHTRWMVSTPDKVADAIVDAGPGGRAERYVPRAYWFAAALRILAPALVRRGTAGGAFTTATKSSTD
jgi:uncharacterized protein